MSRRNPGEGSISKRASGTWQVSLQVNGKRKTIYGKSEREARSKLLEMQKQLAVNGSLPDCGKRTVDDLLTAWLDRARPTLKPRSVTEYEGICDRYIRPTIGKVRLARLTPDHVQAILSDLQARGLARAANYTYVTLHRAMKLGVLWNWLGFNVCDRVLRPTYRAERKDVWDADQLRVFIEGTRDHVYHPLWLTALGTGARLGELLGLHWTTDTDLVNGTIAITKTAQIVKGQRIEVSPKTKSSQRQIALPQEAVSALRRQRAQQNAWRLSLGTWPDHDIVFTAPTGTPLTH